MFCNHLQSIIILSIVFLASCKEEPKKYRLGDNWYHHQHYLINENHKKNCENEDSNEKNNCQSEGDK